MVQRAQVPYMRQAVFFNKHRALGLQNRKKIFLLLDVLQSSAKEKEGEKMKAILKINDKEIEVEMSEELIEKLTEKKKSPFARAEEGELFWCINEIGRVVKTWKETRTDDYGEDRYKVGNYCLDHNLLQQQAYRETLNRLLWRWQYENDEAVDWEKGCSFKYCIFYDYEAKDFFISYYTHCKFQNVYFTTKEKAEQAIEEVIKPFMQEHPDFVW